MKGNICIVSETGWAVSNDATLDYIKEVVDTPNGRKSIPIRFLKVVGLYGKLVLGEKVSIAFQAEDGTKKSYTCEASSVDELRILDETNEYKQTIERILRWQMESQDGY